MSASSMLDNSEISTRRVRLTRSHVYCLLNAGLIAEGKYELLQGDLVEKISPNKPHATCVRRMTAKLEDIFGRAFIGTASPIIIDEFNEPEPDVFVTVEAFSSYSENPTADQVSLVVEISHSTQSYDRNGKALLYARAGITEYWVVNVEAQQVEIFREPSETGYQQTCLFTDNNNFSPLGQPDSQINVSDLF
jgi:Uma2 family endonuclease